MKYSKNFDTQFDFYFRMRKKFTFSGDHLRPKNAISANDILKITFDRKGVDAKEAFFTFESRGILLATRHPLLFFALLKSKASANFHIKELYAKDRANGYLCRMELEEIYDDIKPPQWFKEAVENQTDKMRIALIANGKKPGRLV